MFYVTSHCIPCHEFTLSFLIADASELRNLSVFSTFHLFSSAAAPRRRHLLQPFTCWIDLPTAIHMQYPWPYPQWPSHCAAPTVPTISTQPSPWHQHPPTAPMHTAPFSGHFTTDTSSYVAASSAATPSTYTSLRDPLLPSPVSSPPHAPPAPQPTAQPTSIHWDHSQGIWQPYSLFPPVGHPSPHSHPASTSAIPVPPNPTPSTVVASSPTPVDPSIPQPAGSHPSTPQPAITATVTSIPLTSASTTPAAPPEPVQPLYLHYLLHQKHLQHQLRGLANDHTRNFNKLHLPIRALPLPPASRSTVHSTALVPFPLLPRPHTS